MDSNIPWRKAWAQWSALLHKYGREGRAQAAQYRWSCSMCRQDNLNNSLRPSKERAYQADTSRAAKRLDRCKIRPQGTETETELQACHSTLRLGMVRKWEVPW